VTGEDDFPPERTSVDEVPSFLADPPTRRVAAPCGWCGAEPIPGRDPRWPCKHCGRILVEAQRHCLGCLGPVAYVGMLSQYHRPSSLDEALALAVSSDEHGEKRPVCLACATWWVCTVAPGSWSG